MPVMPPKRLGLLGWDGGSEWNMEMPRIAAVDGDRDIMSLVTEVLIEQGREVLPCHSSERLSAMHAMTTGGEV